MSGLRLLDGKRVDKGALVGRAAVLLPSGLQISDIGIFENGNGRGAQLPAEMMRDASGQPVEDTRTGNPRYISLLRWRSRDAQEKFSFELIELIEREHGPLGGRA
jgi:hypothetical protein